LSCAGLWASQIHADFYYRTFAFVGWVESPKPSILLHSYIGEDVGLRGDGAANPTYFSGC